MTEYIRWSILCLKGSLYRGNSSLLNLDVNKVLRKLNFSRTKSFMHNYAHGCACLCLMKYDQAHGQATFKPFYYSFREVRMAMLMVVLSFGITMLMAV